MATTEAGTSTSTTPLSPDTMSGNAFGIWMARTGDQLLQTNPLAQVRWSFYTSHVTGQGGPSQPFADFLTKYGISYNTIPADYLLSEPIPTGVSQGRINNFLGAQAEAADALGLKDTLRGQADWFTTNKALTEVETFKGTRVYDSIFTYESSSGAVTLLNEVKSGYVSKSGTALEQATKDVFYQNELNMGTAGARGVGEAMRVLGTSVTGVMAGLDLAVTSYQMAQEYGAGDLNGAAWTATSFAGRWYASIWGAALGGMVAGPAGALVGGLLAGPYADSLLEGLRDSNPNLIGDILDQLLPPGWRDAINPPPPGDPGGNGTEDDGSGGGGTGSDGSGGDTGSRGSASGSASGSSGGGRTGAWIRGFHPFRRRDPLVLDLSGAGLNLTSVDASAAAFDYDSTGYAVQTGWIGAGQGLLVRKPLDDSTQVTADQLIGARSGRALSELAALDANRDGKLDSADAGFASLGVWIDANGDGRNAPGEIVSLASLGIVAFDLATQASAAAVAGNQVVATGSFVRADQTSGRFAEVDFTVNTFLTRYTASDTLQVPVVLRMLPNLAGYGHVADLVYAMTINGDLAKEVGKLVVDAGLMKPAEFRGAFEHMMQSWAQSTWVGARDGGTATTARVDAGHLAVVEAFLGTTWTAQNGAVAIDGFSAREIERTYRTIIDHQEARFIAQVTGSQLNLGVGYDQVVGNPFVDFSLIGVDVRSDTIDIDFTAVVDSILGDMAASSDGLAYAEQAGSLLPVLAADLFAGEASAELTAIRAAAESSGVQGGYADMLLSQLKTTLHAAGGAVSLTGTAVDETLYADGVVGTLAGGQGSDSYVYRSGQGNLVIEEHWKAYQPAEQNQLLLADLRPSQVELTRRGDDLLVKDLTTGQTIQISSHFLSWDGISEIAFANGSVWSRADILARAWMRGTDSGEIIAGSVDADTIMGGRGDDVLRGGAADDAYIYRSGDGSDRIEEAWQPYQTAQRNRLSLIDLTPTDVELARLGNDLFIKDLKTGQVVTVAGQFYDTAGVTSIDFSDGVTFDRTKILALAAFRGTSGADSLVGSSGGDTIIGGLGDDLLAGGQGNDVYVYKSGDGNDRVEEHWQAYWTQEANSLVLSDLNATDVQLSRSGADLLIKDIRTGQTITVTGHFNAFDGIASITFADGSSMDRNQIQAAAWIRGTDSSEQLAGSMLSETMIGGLGNDTLSGGQGNDTYIYRSGDGNDVIEEHWQAYWTQETNRLVLSDLKTSDVQLVHNGADLLIKDLKTGQTIKVTGHFNSFDGLASIAFADGASLDRAAILAAAVIQGTSANDSITFGGYATLDMGKGDDTVKFSTGNNAALAGDVTVLFRKGDGHDLYWANLAGDLKSATLKLLDINRSEVSFAFNPSALHNNAIPNDVVMTVTATGDSVAMGLENMPGYPAFEKIVFADGSTMGRAEIIAASVFKGTTGNDTKSFGGTGTVDMGKGDDLVKFDSGNVSAMAGDVTVVFRKGDGHDAYWANYAADLKSATLKLLDINRSEVSFTFNAAATHSVAIPNDVVMTVIATGDSVAMGSENLPGYPAFEKIVFADGSTMSRADILAAAVFTGTASADSKSFGGSGIVDMGKGDDSLKFTTGNIASLAGDVTVLFRKGDGHDAYWANLAGDLKSATLKLLDINRSEVAFTFNTTYLHSGALPNDVTMTVTATGDSVNMGLENLAGFPSFEKIIFADGSTMSRAEIIAASVFKGTTGNDSKSFGGNGIVDMGKGDDSVKFDAGGSLSVAGDVTVLFRKGDGHDTYWANTASDLRSATLKLIDINRSEVVFNMNPAYRHDGTLVNDITMVVTATGDSVNMGLENWAGMPSFTSIVFADGSTMSRADIQAAAWFRGGDGADTLSGSSVADTIFGGKGNDTLTGLAGADTFVFGPQTGHDVVTDFKVTDRDALVFDRSLFASPASVLAASTQVGTDVRIAMTSTDDVLLKGVQLSSLASADIRLA